jgi:hypothetical protein
MAVFVAASDETTGATHRHPFMRAGFLAPLDDWTLLTAQWDTRVLAGPPRIPYLHMTEIRSPKFLAAWNLDQVDADRRVDEAFKVISEWPSLTPVGMTVDSAHLYDNYTDKVLLTSGAKKKFVPDYLAFTSYAYAAILFCQQFRPDMERVDFVVERNGELTDHIKDFYVGMATACEANGHPELIQFLGDLIPAGKDRVPLQAADVLCWHTQRYEKGTLDAKAIEQFSDIAKREGVRFEYNASILAELWGNFHEPEPGISEFQSGDEYDPPSRPKSGESCDGDGDA